MRVTSCSSLGSPGLPLYKPCWLHECDWLSSFAAAKCHFLCDPSLASLKKKKDLLIHGSQQAGSDEACLSKLQSSAYCSIWLGERQILGAVDLISPNVVIR